MNHKKILFCIYCLHVGGAERVLTTIANYWAEKGHDISILTIRPQKEDFYPLNKNIKRVSIGDAKIQFPILRDIIRLFILRKYIQKNRPDSIISFMYRMNMLATLAVFGKPTPIIISERCSAYGEPVGRMTNYARRFLYKFSNALVVQTNDMRVWAETFLQKKAIFLIRNPLSSRQKSSKKALKKGDKKFITGLGFKPHQKGFDLLIQAFSQCKKKDDSWYLQLVGIPDSCTQLSDLSRDLGVSNKVLFEGIVSDVQAYLLNADIFVLSSRFEGFPNALLEAMSLGKPAISFDCKSGPGEIIENEKNGLLVPAMDVPALSNAMDRLISEEELRKCLGQEALKINLLLEINRIMGQWETIIDNLRK